jgi:hypothetical protein
MMNMIVRSMNIDNYHSGEGFEQFLLLSHLNVRTELYSPLSSNISGHNNIK